MKFKHMLGISSAIPLAITLLGSLAFAGGETSGGGGGGTFSATFREGLIQAALRDEGRRNAFRDRYRARHAPCALSKKKRLEWMAALNDAAERSGSIRVTSKPLADEGVPVAAYASDPAKGRVIELSVPYLLESGLNPDQAFVLAVHETGHWIFNMEELTDHNDLDQVGLLLLDAVKHPNVVLKNTPSRAAPSSPEVCKLTVEAKLLSGKASMKFYINNASDLDNGKLSLRERPKLFSTEFADEASVSVPCDMKKLISWEVGGDTWTRYTMSIRGDLQGGETTYDGVL